MGLICRISLKRSTVILTQLQYPAFFTRLASVFGPLYDIHGLPMLEPACHNIAAWYVWCDLLCFLSPIARFAKERCDPTPGRTVELDFLGTALHLEIPNTVDDQQLTETPSFQEKYDPQTHVR